MGITRSLIVALGFGILVVGLVLMGGPAPMHEIYNAFPSMEWFSEDPAVAPTSAANPLDDILSLSTTPLAPSKPLSH